MKTEIIHCDLCGKVVVADQINRPKYGVTLTLGYSKGGWGRREDSVNWTGEVCEACFDEYQVIARAIAHWLTKRNGSRMPRIVIDEFMNVGEHLAPP